MIINIHDAAEAYKIARETQVWARQDVEGWTFLGEGSYRSVWTKDGEVAYKIAHDEDPTANDPEWYNYQDWSEKLPAGIEMPQMMALTYNGETIIAVEVVQGKHPEWDPPEWISNFLARTMEVFDCVSHNIVERADGVFVLLDFTH